MIADRFLTKHSNTISIILSLCIACLVTAWCLWNNNFHTLIPKKYYRSSQLGPEVLNRLIKDKHLKSVMNLRGKNPYAWYQQEAIITHNNTIPLYNVRLSALLLPPHPMLLKIATILQTAPKPMLIHCASGIDRTGLVSAMIYLLNGKTLHQAWYETSWHYGAVRHMSAGKQMLRQYQHWLTQQHYTDSTAQLFTTWLHECLASNAHCQ